MKYFHTMQGLLCLMGAVSASAADSSSRDTEKSYDNSRLWICTFRSGQGTGSTAVRLDAIASVSKHSYLVNGIPVKEVTIDTTGNNSIRIYCMANHEIVQKTLERASQAQSMMQNKTNGALQLPQKKFPEGTYSHNIEFQVSQPSELDKIYDSVMEAFSNNKGCTYKAK